MNNFIESNEFVEHLNSWIFKSDRKDSNWIYANRNKIPSIFKKNSNYLYKGLISIPEMFDFKTGFVKLHGTVSFSEDSNIAKKFLLDNKYKFKDREGIKILIKKKFSSVLFDVYKYFLFYGEDRLLKMGYDELNIDSMKNEKEILIHDAKIYSKDFIIIK